MDLRSLALLGLMAALRVAAQTTGAPFVPLDGVVNGANFLPGCAPNGGIAQGALFTVFGRDIGPTVLAQVRAFPLSTTLDGVSIRVTMNGAGYDAWPLYATATQVGAVLPSQVPPGDGQLTLTYRGRAAEPVPIRVRPNAPGIFTANSRGNGQAAVENVAANGAASLNGPANPLRPGQLATIWGTGLGPAPAGNEAAGPLPGNQPQIETRVWVGDRLARVAYRGRSGCCAGVDQIVFETPAGLEGCQVPLSIEAGGVTSNFGSIAIAASGTRCLATPRAAPVNGTDPNFRLGLVIFLDGFGSVLLPEAGDDYVRLGFFQRGSVAGDVEAPLYAFEANSEVPPGSCAVRYGTEFPAQPSQPRQSPLDAGPELRIAGPGGAFRLLQNSLNAGTYEDPQRVGLPAPGRYVVDNGAAGGKDVGPFVFETEAVRLRLTSPRDRIARNENLTMTWDYQGPPDQLLTVFGSSRGACGRELISFSCVTRAADRRFVVPARILSLLPPSTSFFGVSNGALNISMTGPGGLRRFPAPGLDLGLFLHLAISAIRPTYE